MSKPKLLLVIYFLLVPLVLTFVFMYGVKSGEFIFSHDEYILLTLDNAKRSFLVQLPLDFGTSNTAVMIVTVFSRLYYLFVYSLGLSVTVAQYILYFIKLFLALLLPYIGLKKIARNIFNASDNSFLLVLISFFYTFNNFSLIYWHGNNFELTLLVSYYLAPLTFYFLHKVLFDKNFNVRYLIAAEVCMFLSAFAFYLFGAFALLVAVYSVYYILAFNYSVFKFLKRASLLIFMFIPFIPLFSLIIYEMVFSSVKGIYTNGGETYNNLQGGMLYPLFMWFSWGIYTDWAPRNIFTFNNFFKTPVFILSPFILYIYFIWSIFKKKHSRHLLILLLAFITFIFLVKGAQAPFGFLFEDLLDNLVFFRIFRSPDNKFGYAIVLCLTLGLLSLINRVDRRIQVAVLFTVIAIQSSLIVSGVAIRGQVTSQSSDRIVGYYDSTQEVIDYINTLEVDNKSILPYPPSEFGYFMLNENDFQIGQELISKKVNKPFLFYSRYSGISKESYDLLTRLLIEKDFSVLGSLPISHILIREDAPRTHVDPEFIAAVETYPLVFKNDTYRLYQLSTPSYLYSSAPYELTLVNDVYYQLKIDSANKDFTVHLNQNFNPLWKLYEISQTEYDSCIQELCYKNSVVTKHDFTAPFLQSVGEHTRYKKAFNQWHVAGNDATTRYFVLHFALQSLFYYGVLIAGVYLLVCVSVLCLPARRFFRWQKN